MPNTVPAEPRMLQHFLDAQRTSALAIVEGLDGTQLRTPILTGSDQYWNGGWR